MVTKENVKLTTSYLLKKIAEMRVCDNLDYNVMFDVEHHLRVLTNLAIGNLKKEMIITNISDICKKEHSPDVSNNKCVKQEVIAMVYKDGKYWLGSNWCANPQSVCPRDKQNMKSGEGYELCTTVCQQKYHAEVDACKSAGKENCNGATLYLVGHTYCCDNCISVMKEMGIKEVVIGYLPNTKLERI